MSTRCPDTCSRVNAVNRSGHQVTYNATRTTENRGQTTSETSSLLSVGTYENRDALVRRNERSSCLEERMLTREGTRERRTASQHAVTRTTTRRTERGPSNEAHDPCLSECPTTRARDRAAKKVADRQRRLDEYLLGKGWGYFDEVCACSSMCLLNQLWNDPFVKNVLRSACFFAVGMKLCAELDAWHMVG